MHPPFWDSGSLNFSHGRQLTPNRCKPWRGGVGLGRCRAPLLTCVESRRWRALSFCIEKDSLCRLLWYRSEYWYSVAMHFMSAREWVAWFSLKWRVTDWVPEREARPCPGWVLNGCFYKWCLSVLGDQCSERCWLKVGGFFLFRPQVYEIGYFAIYLCEVPVSPQFSVSDGWNICDRKNPRLPVKVK